MKIWKFAEFADYFTPHPASSDLVALLPR